MARGSQGLSLSLSLSFCASFFLFLSLSLSLDPCLFSFGSLRSSFRCPLSSLFSLMFFMPFPCSCFLSVSLFFSSCFLLLICFFIYRSCSVYLCSSLNLCLFIYLYLSLSLALSPSLSLSLHVFFSFSSSLLQFGTNISSCWSTPPNSGGGSTSKLA